MPLDACPCHYARRQNGNRRAGCTEKYKRRPVGSPELSLIVFSLSGPPSGMLYFPMHIAPGCARFCKVLFDMGQIFVIKSKE